LKDYHSQDTNRKRNASSSKLVNRLEALIKGSPKWYIYHNAFAKSNPPTLDQINSLIRHTIDNSSACCEKDNRKKYDGNVDVAGYKT
jgi:hypothetical protein